MMTETLEERVGRIAPRLAERNVDAFPQGRWAEAGKAVEHSTPSGEVHRGLLMPDEMMELQFCEQRIERGLETFLEVGLALSLIRDKRLYRISHETFEEYCQARWDIKASRARQLCAAAELVQGLKSKAESRDELLPTSERQARPLMGLPPEQQRTVWKEAVASAPGGRVTGAHVAACVNRLTGKRSTLNAQRSTSKVCDAGTRGERLRALADRAIADMRELLDLQGAADSAAVADVVVSIGKLEAFRDHLGRVEKLQGARV